jgi:hypothetical protein
MEKSLKPEDQKKEGSSSIIIWGQARQPGTSSASGAEKSPPMLSV